MANSGFLGNWNVTTSDMPNIFPVGTKVNTFLNADAGWTRLQWNLPNGSGQPNLGPQHTIHDLTAAGAQLVNDELDDDTSVTLTLNSNGTLTATFQANTIGVTGPFWPESGTWTAEEQP